MNQAGAAPAAGRGGLQGMHVLLVDDCVDALVPLAALLEMSGAEVATAENGQQALECLRSAPCDVLVSDLRMPVMSGVELIRAVRADAALPQPVAIAYSGYSTLATREVVDAGFDAVLTKPLGIDKLQQVIVALRAGGRP